MEGQTTQLAQTNEPWTRAEYYTTRYGKRLPWLLCLFALFVLLVAWIIMAIIRLSAGDGSIWSDFRLIALIFGPQFVLQLSRPYCYQLSDEQLLGISLFGPTMKRSLKDYARALPEGRRNNVRIERKVGSGFLVLCVHNRDAFIREINERLGSLDRSKDENNE